MKNIFLVLLLALYYNMNSQAPIVYDWDNSKEGWVSGGNCNLTSQSGAMAMRLYSSNALMRSGNVSANLGISASDYNLVEVTVKNPTTGSGIARLFLYPPGTNSDTCYYTFQVDTAMTGFTTYSISLDSIPSGGLSSVYNGPIARFGLRAPWGGQNFDTIFWKEMVVSNTNQVVDSVQVTFKLDMSQVNTPFTSPEINGTFNSWCGSCDQMTDADNDNVWEKEISFMPNDTIEYKFSADSWSIQESLDPNEVCTNGNVNFTNRLLIIPNSDDTLSVVCWESCSPCPPLAITSNEISLEIYPNPSNEFINMNSSGIIEKVVLRDILGKVYFIEKPMKNKFYLDVNKIPNNIYFLEAFVNERWINNKIMVLH